MGNSIGSSSDLDTKISKARKTKVLSLSDMKLKRLPDEVGEIEELKNLDISQNKLKLFPEMVINLNRLKTLNISRNPLGRDLEVDMSVGLGSLTTLLMVEVGWEGGERVIFPSSLTTLNLSLNPISPSTISSLSQSNMSLLTLDLSGCGLEIVVDEIGEMVSVRELLLDDNFISFLPSTISSLSSLTTLSLKRNRMTGGGIPPSLFPMGRLERVDLHGNDISVGELREVEGFELFEERRRKLKSKQISGVRNSINYFDYYLLGG